MRALYHLPLFTLSLVLASCERPAAHAAAIAAPEVAEQESIAEIEAAIDLTSSFVRISSTRQEWNPGQPWEKSPPQRRRSLGAIVAPGQVLTSAEMVADATFLELTSTDDRRRASAKVIAVDYEANLALIGPEEPDSTFFEGTTPLEIAGISKPGEILEIFQVEENGNPLVTRGPIQSINVVSNFLPGHFFLNYEVKASMQSAASSFSLPVLRDGKLAGLLTSYNSKDQISDVICTEIIARFIAKAGDGEYEGFPSLGITTSSTEDANFRAWLKLPDDAGGLYVSKVRKTGPAEKAGLLKGDVILSIDGFQVDRLGYVDHEIYGRLFWSHLIRGAKGAGEEAALSILRDGEPVDLTAKLERHELNNELVPAYTFGQAPNYLVKGGLVFQELTRPLLEAFGEEWQSRAPLNLLDVIENPEKYEERADRIVFLAGVVATPATVGYEPLRNLIVTEVNGSPVRDMKGLIAAFDQVPADGLHSIRFDEEEMTVYLDEVLSTSVDEQLIQRGLTRLSRAE